MKDDNTIYIVMSHDYDTEVTTSVSAHTTNRRAKDAIVDLEEDDNDPPFYYVNPVQLEG